MNTTMEHIHGVDISWMTHGSAKDHNAPKPTSRRRNTLQSQPQAQTQSPSPTSGSPPPASPSTSSPRSPSSPVPIPAGNAANPLPLSSSLPSLPSLPSSPSGGLRGRRPSWFSNISSKFSANGASSPPQATSTMPKQAELSVPRANPAKNAVLQHAAKYEGEGPYTPAPPKSSSQASLLHVFRRLSTSGGHTGPVVKGNHGLVERRVLNVDHARERCRLQELDQAKLRRVAFSVDVEIAPMPKYADQQPVSRVSVSAGSAPADMTQKKKIIEKSEGDALKNAKVLTATEANQPPKPSTATSSPAASSSSPSSNPSLNPSSSPSNGSSTSAAAPAKAATAPAKTTESSPPPISVPNAKKTTDTNATKSSSPPRAAASSEKAPADGAPADPNKKKEKKKRSEEERKLRKERKRRQAEANGLIPIEIHLDSDESDTRTPTGPKSSSPSTTPATPRLQLTPTTNPLRIYRRCCQLRETPILKKVAEQLSDPAILSTENGIVTKLDLTGYWLHLADVITLGDFLAVVPIREVILENCGLNDEGLRVILSGLLAAHKSQKKTLHLHNLHRRLRSTGSAAKSGTASRETQQGGVVERLVLKNNKVGVEGWRHICLFIHMAHSLKALDLSNVVFPHSVLSQALHLVHSHDKHHVDVCQLLSKSIAERLAGPTLELLNFGDTGLTSEQLGWIVDGMIQSGTKRLGLAHNDLDEAGVQHVARYVASGRCEGLDLGGNDLHNRVEILADAVASSTSLWALSLADCNLAPSGLCKLLPKLVHLPNFRFIDLSHNHKLFEARPSATVLLRRYLPMMESLKRLHLSDVAMNSEQAIAIAEVLPEVKELAHLSILQNPELTKLADARTEETQEQACALYASFLAATRLSKSIVAVDMPVPTPESSEIVRAMAKQVLAYCLRNVDRVTLGNPAALVVLGNAQSVPPTTDLADTSSDSTSSKTSLGKSSVDYPDVLQHLVGHDAAIVDSDEDIDAAPDDDYVIGGTGVAQALECCLKNRGPELTDPSPGEFVLDSDSLPPPGKAKDMSKHLLQSARKIRMRLQPALQKAATGDNQAYHRLLFLDSTLDGIIKRFEDEFPETRVSTDSGVFLLQNAAEKLNQPHVPSVDSGDTEADLEVEAEGDMAAAFLSDGEDETDILPSRLSRSNSIMSLSSKGLTNEEGRMLRAGHRFRSGWFKHYNLFSGVDEISSDPAHRRVLYELINELNDADINKKLAEKGIVRLFKEDRDQILRILKEQDPEHFERFMESQEKARANVEIELGDAGQEGGSAMSPVDTNESAILDD